MKTLRAQLYAARDKLFPRHCQRKVRYPNQRVAEKAKAVRERDAGIKLRAYQCFADGCNGGWHITKMNEGT